MSATNEPRRSLIILIHVIYGLHAASLITGIIGAATVVGAFLTGWPSIIAVILNYAKRSEARGTWLESHFRWQIRTFWFGLLWVTLCATRWIDNQTASSGSGARTGGSCPRCLGERLDMRWAIDVMHPLAG